MKGFLIGAPTSHSGKSTVTAALLRALRIRGLRVQPFKCGPDYIDTQLHRLACGEESVNLDTFLSSPSHVEELYHRYEEGADMCVVEGAMGLFDGYDRDEGSAASIASLLALPVILVVDARSVAYSAAPLIHGFATFRRESPLSPQEASASRGEISLAGVVFNQVGSERHYRMLRQACEDAHVACLGYLPRNPQFTIEDRHLGLALDCGGRLEEIVSLAAKEAERHIDIDALLRL